MPASVRAFLFTLKYKTMSKEVTETKIASDGLRYKAKVSGSPFGQQSNGNSTMSCFKCGQHKPRALGRYKRVLNQSMFFCGDCKPIAKAV
jgi:hypothetical protein